MIVKSIFNIGESYTHDDWVYRDLNVGFSRLYYILDGEGFYEEDGKTVPFRKGWLYLTPVNRKFSLYDNEKNKMLHTYTHIYTCFQMLCQAYAESAPYLDLKINRMK